MTINNLHICGFHSFPFPVMPQLKKTGAKGVICALSALLVSTQQLADGCGSSAEKEYNSSCFTRWFCAL